MTEDHYGWSSVDPEQPDCLAAWRIGAHLRGRHDRHCRRPLHGLLRGWAS